MAGVERFLDRIAQLRDGQALGITPEMTLHEWREVARVSIARRDYRIALGLGPRKRRNGAETETSAWPA